ncbi:MAG TPA: ribonuclease R [Ruminococcaceae bacterium]|nr:ribonuclease R [Oscillospiraceae bacterium]
MKKEKAQILQYIKKVPQGSMAHNIYKKLGMKDKKEFYKALDELKSEGYITIGKKHRVHFIGKRNRVGATVVSLSRGFAFADPDIGSDSVFIHSDKLGGAFVGDKVLLRNVQEGPKGLNGEVDSILEKSSRLITGTLKKCSGGGFELLPDCAVRYPLKVAGKKKSAVVHDGDKVQAMARRTPHSSEIECSVVKVYGKAGSARICADAILDRYGIRTSFPSGVAAEAKKAASAAIAPDDLKGRLDLRKTSICTIDGADAKDLDDAISVSRTHSGYKLGVHIADVSHYVKEGGRLDGEAFARGTSVYFADRVVPMLPEEISNGVCSLNAGEDKLAFSALIELDKTGEILSYKFRKSVIRSKVRGVYSEVNKIFNKTADKELREKYSPVIRSLNAARELAGLLKQRETERGYFDIETTEPVFTLDKRGICVGVEPRQSGEAEEMIEYLMITANRAAAKLAKASGIPFIYRVHEPPDPERVETLAALVDALGLNSRSVKHKGNVTSADFSAVMDQARGTPLEKVVSHQLLRTMAKARYDTKPIGHFGLALDDYCHFTSPIRRYPDTSIHRILTSFIETKDKAALKKKYEKFAAESAKASSAAEIKAMGAERDSEDCYMAEYIRQHIGECYDAIISGVTQRGVFAVLENTVEGFIPIESFGGNYRFDGMVSHVDETAGKKLTIGMAVKIKVAAADVASGRIDFEYAGR